jgi:hypothetical protein
MSDIVGGSNPAISPPNRKDRMTLIPLQILINEAFLQIAGESEAQRSVIVSVQSETKGSYWSFHLID